jgi:2-keto-4-pentenoate hydratase/2-oxohepta-3-ene-1,7-dioic acid hydratase in catechol pathway
LIFLKPSTSVIGPGAPILLPQSSSRVEFEGELAVVIGRPCRDVKAENAQSVILGYTVANDVTARDLQRADVQFTRGKSFDSFCPIGPWIETELDPTDVEIRTELDDEVKQDGHTSDMVHSVAAQIEFISAVMTLLPGDIILTGTPAGVGAMVAGQTVSVTVEGIGTLTNPVLDR